MVHGHAEYTHNFEGQQAFTVQMDVECQNSDWRLFDLDLERSRCDLVDAAPGWRAVGISEVSVEREESPQRGGISSLGHENRWDRWVCHGNVLMEYGFGAHVVSLLTVLVRFKMTLLPNGAAEAAPPVVKTRIVRP